MSRQLFEYHPVIGYRYIPGIKARVPYESGGFLIRVNSSGFRCRHEFAAAKPPGN
jgi:carbamoyltransferase